MLLRTTIVIDIQPISCSQKAFANIVRMDLATKHEAIEAGVHRDL